MSSLVQAQQKQAIQIFQNQPPKYFKEILGAPFEGYQNRVAQTVADNSRTAIAACHDLGKSYTMARIVIWFATCFPYSKVITTAPTFNQVKNILWSEIRSAYGKSKMPLGGVMLQTEWQLSKDGDHFAIGFTPRNEVTGGDGQGTQSSFQGFHAPYVLVVFDEATGIPHNIWTMAEGLLTSANVKFVAIGNPTSRNSEFFKCFRSPEWAKVYLSCFDAPNLIANGITNLNALTTELDYLRGLPEKTAQERLRSYKVARPWGLSTGWVMGRAMKWGITHPLFVSKVLGTFPEEGDNTLMPLGVVEQAQLRIVNPEDDDGKGNRRTLGCDIARFGTDSSVLTDQTGSKVTERRVFIKRDTVEVSGEIINMARPKTPLERWPDVIVVDETGIGSGVVDNLRHAQRDRIIPYSVEIRGVQFGASPKCQRHERGLECDHKNDCDKAKYTNLKGRMFDLLGQDLKKDLSLLPDDVYLDELPTILYAYNAKGQMVIESKDEYKRRTGRNSPDNADSLALANYGRYDESPIGIFSDDLNHAPAPMAGGLNSRDTW